MIKFYNDKFMRKQLQAVFFEKGETNIEEKFKELLSELKKTKEKDLQELYKKIDEFDYFDSNISFDQPKEIQLVIERLLSKINMYSSALIQDVENTTDVAFSEDNLDISQIGTLFVSGLTKFSNLKQLLTQNLRKQKERSVIIEKTIQVRITDLENNVQKERETNEYDNRIIYDIQKNILSNISIIENSVQTLNQRLEQNLQQQNATSKSSLVMKQDTHINQFKNFYNIEQTQQNLTKKYDNLLKKVQSSQSKQENNINKQQELLKVIKNILFQIQDSVQELQETNNKNDSDSFQRNQTDSDPNFNDQISRESEENQSDDSDSTEYYLMMLESKEKEERDKTLAYQQNARVEKRKEIKRKRIVRKQERKVSKEEKLEDRIREYYFKNLNLTILDFDDYDRCQMYEIENNKIQIELEASSFSVIFTDEINYETSYTMRFQLSASYGDYEELQIGIASGNMKIFIKDQKKNLLRKDFYSKLQTNLKGDFHNFIKENEAKEIEMRVCVFKGRIQFADYPNYNHVVENKFPMNQMLDYRIAISVYQYNNPNIIVTYYEETDDFNSF